MARKEKHSPSAFFFAYLVPVASRRDCRCSPESLPLIGYSSVNSMYALVTLLKTVIYAFDSVVLLSVTTLDWVGMPFALDKWQKEPLGMEQQLK
jgi:hypothetical protein